MKQSLKSFFQMVKYETIRIIRNKPVILMLLLFSLVFVVILSSLNTGTEISFALLGDKSTLESSSLAIFEDVYNEDKITYVSSVEDGLSLLKTGKVAIFLELDYSQTPANVIVHYDDSTFAGNVVKNVVSSKKDTLSFELVTEYLEDVGIKINKSYFDFIEFNSLSGQELSSSVRSFPLDLALGISAILMLGLAYSVAKDNETKVAKNIAYLPISINKYLLSKLSPYIVLGLLETFLIILLGQLAFGVSLATNILLITLLTLPFILATGTLSLLFSNFKNQVSTFFCDLFALLVPTVMLSLTYINGLPILIQFFLYLLPLTPYVQLLNGMIFTGTILWQHIIVLVLQVVVYYVSSYLIAKYKTRA